MRKAIEQAKATYLAGMRVRLIKMDDIQAPPIGTEGTVRGVDDIGSVMVAWDNGSGLNAVLGEDEIEVVRTCPICGKEYTGHPVMSRKDDRTEKCSECDTKEALEVYTLYSQEGDITFIMEDKKNTTSVVGFYYGEPNDENTREFRGKLTAEFE